MKDQYDMSKSLCLTVILLIYLWKWYKIDPVVFECDMSIVAIKWNHNGSVLALVGSLMIDGDVKESNVLQLYSPYGEVSFN